MPNLITLGATVLLATGQGTYDFKRGSREARLERVPLVNGDGEYVKDLGRNGAIHLMQIRRPVATADVTGIYTLYDGIQSESPATLTVPDQPTIPYCVLIEEPDYSEQRKIQLYSSGTLTDGYLINIDLTFLQMRG